MNDIHVLPVSDLVDHDEERTCWCGPRLDLPCDECEDGCWKCDGGGNAVDADHPAVLVVIHNAADGRE